MLLNSTASKTTSYIFDSTTNGMTSTQFRIHYGGGNNANISGASYIAYLFADNSSEDAADRMISCGSLTVSSQATAIVNLGFEAQWVMLKRSDGTGNWFMFDVMRGMAIDSFEWLYANTSMAGEEKAYQSVFPTSTGFGFNPVSNGQLVDGNYIYMAVRREDMAEVTDATKVFNSTAGLGTNPQWKPGFTVDFELYRRRTGTQIFHAGARITGNKYLRTNDNSVQSDDSDLKWDYQDGFYSHTGYDNTYQAWMWKRAKGYFDVVCYTGTGSARTIAHSLGAAPEMMWIKRRNGTGHWFVYSKHAPDISDTPDIPSRQQYMKLNDNGESSNIGSAYWNDTDPTATVFSLASTSSTNGSGDTFIAYLFATLAGVSKLGSYTGNDTGQNIDCGFTSGARFVLIKCTSQSDRSWMVFDSTRGIVAGADPFLTLEATSAENYASNGAGSIQNYSGSNLDLIDPLSSGFAVVGGTGMVNENGEKYIFYAIA
jgi:hypothetical protein